MEFMLHHLHVSAEGDMRDDAILSISIGPQLSPPPTKYSFWLGPKCLTATF